MNQITDFLGLKILRSASSKFSSADLKDIDLVEIIPPIGIGFIRPLKISWRKVLDSRPMIEQIRSKRAHKHIKTDSHKIEAMGIKIQSFAEINEIQFIQWFTFYKAKMKDKDHGRLALEKDWFSQKLKSGKKVGGVFAFKGKEMIGGDLFHLSNNRLSASFGVYEDLPTLAGSLGLIIDYQFLIEAQRQGYKEVSFGQDTNLYGFHLTSGLMFYKAKLGFSPVPAVKTEYTSTFFVNFTKFADPIMFFVKDGDGLKLIIITKESQTEEIYLPEGITKSESYSRDQVKTLSTF